MAAYSMTIGNQVLFLAAGLSIIAGFFINVFMVAVNISDWKKGRPVSTADNVITSLGISRMVFQVTCVFNVIRDIYFNRLSSLFFMPFMFLEVTSIYSSIWLSTFLSVIYCLKISTLQNAFFLQLKIIVLNKVLHMIVASVVVSISFALVFCLLDAFKIPHNSTQETHFNEMTVWIFATLIFWFTGPFLIYFFSSVLLIIYLYHHVSRMRFERKKASNLDIYHKTIKFTGFSLFCSTLYLIIQQTHLYWFKVLGISGFYVFWQIFPTLHSIYLIYVTAKLRTQVFNMVHMLRRRCGDPKARVETAFS